jgi:hypothetical protein
MRFEGVGALIYPDSHSPWFKSFVPHVNWVERFQSYYLVFYFNDAYTLEPYVEVALDNNCYVSGGLAPTLTPTLTTTPTQTLIPSTTPTRTPTETPKTPGPK